MDFDTILQLLLSIFFIGQVICISFWSQVWLWRSSTCIFPTILKMQDLSLFLKPIIWNFCIDWKSWPSLVCSARGGPLPWLVESVSSKLQCSNTGNSGNSDIDYITVTALPSTYQCPRTGPDLENMEIFFLRIVKSFLIFVSHQFLPILIMHFWSNSFPLIFFLPVSATARTWTGQDGWVEVG